MEIEAGKCLHNGHNYDDFSHLIFKFTLCSIFADTGRRARPALLRECEMAARRRAFGAPVRLGIVEYRESGKWYTLSRRYSACKLGGADGA